MNQKQCKRMFEQMQPPEAVVQRLQQKIRAEEDAIPPSLRSARQAQIVRFTKASSKPPRPSWRSITTGATAAVLLLGIGTSIGYHLQKTNPFVPSSESSQDPWSMQQTTIQSQETDVAAIWDSQSDAEKYDSLLYNGISWRRASVLDGTTQLGGILGEGTLSGGATLNENTTISQETGLVPVYDVQIAGCEEQYAVAVKLDETYYFFTRSLENITTLRELPILESTVSPVSFVFLQDTETAIVYDGEGLPVSALQPLFTFLQNNQNSMNLYTGLSLEAGEQNLQISDEFVWDYAIDLTSEWLGFSGALYFDIDTGIFKTDISDNPAYFMTTPDTLASLLSDLQMICQTESSMEPKVETTDQTAIAEPSENVPTATTLDTTVQDLLPKLREAHLQFQKVSGVMQKKKTAYMQQVQDEITTTVVQDETNDVNATLSFQMDLTNGTKNVVYAVNNEMPLEISTAAPEDDVIWRLSNEQLSHQEIWTKDNRYTIYPDLKYYYKLKASTNDWSQEDFAVNIFMDSNGDFGNGVFYMAKQFSDIVLQNEPADIVLFGTANYLGRNCYVLVEYQHNSKAAIRYLIDKEYGISLKTESCGEGIETSRYFTEIAFDEAAEPVPTVEESTLLDGLEPIPDYIP